MEHSGANYYRKNDFMTIKVIAPNQNINFNVSVGKTASVFDLKNQISEEIKKSNHHALMYFENPSAQRLIFQGAIMTPDTQPIQSWASLANGSAIHLIKKPGRSPDDQPTNQVQPAQTDDNLERRAQNARVAGKPRNCKILQKNFAACVNAAQEGMDPDAR